MTTGTTETLARIETVHADQIRDALLPVLALCGKKDHPNYAFFGALCIDSSAEDIEFWVTDDRSVFMSMVKPDTLQGPIYTTIRPSHFGLLAAHIKAAKTISLEFRRNDETRVTELIVATDNGSITVSDDPDIKHPNIRPYYEMGDDSTPGAEGACFRTKNYLRMLSAFKGVERMIFNYSDKEHKLRIRTAPDEPFLRFDALVMGCER